jgi:pimeloyl-ACP methyl ester carboxylesterase
MSQTLSSRSKNPGGASRAESSARVSPDTRFVMPETSIRTLEADAIRVFYREAGPPDELDLLLDYASNVRLYPAFQRYFRERQPPLLAIWGKHDPFFIPAGAEAFRNDIRDAQVQFLDTGHFATETHVVEIAAAMREFLDAKRRVARSA